MTKRNDNEIVSRILNALDEIRPYLQTDGGDISFININENNEVMIKLLGACGNCSMNIQTLKLGVERTIQRAVPEVTRVIAIDDNMDTVPNE
ncbi:MAG: NifU family protein [Bacteroidales bacterium]